jgi:hypothetical protein
MILGIPKHLPNQPCRLTNILVHNRRRHDFQKVGVEGRSDGPGEERFACTGGPVEEDSLGGFDADADKEFGVFEGEFDDFAELTDLFGETADAGEGDLAGVFERHVEDEGVNFAGEHSHDRQRRHVKGYASQYQTYLKK